VFCVFFFFFQTPPSKPGDWTPKMIPNPTTSAKVHVNVSSMSNLKSS